MLFLINVEKYFVDDDDDDEDRFYRFHIMNLPSK